MSAVSETDDTHKISYYNMEQSIMFHFVQTKTGF